MGIVAKINPTPGPYAMPVLRTVSLNSASPPISPHNVLVMNDHIISPTKIVENATAII
ncbi:uncharacterized protein METZ01_LOCUS34564 [marine metagenome]|uniref:Uncharacterized protein n=1 Tax=marine metagenome TaxID=408172 RepID=A0A381QRH3_9ZZZZ